MSNQSKITVQIPENSCDLSFLFKTKSDEMWGEWSEQTISKYSSLVESLPGDFVEIGIAAGSTFWRLCLLAQAQGKHPHAIDSFIGMDEPGEFDRPTRSDGAPPKGHFSVGGPEGFTRLMTARGVLEGTYSLWPGCIPANFAGSQGLYVSLWESLMSTIITPQSIVSSGFGLE